MPTAKVRLGSEISRKGWLSKGLLGAASKSFWQPYTGATNDAIIYQRTDASCSKGHTIVFDYSGKLTGKGYRGDDYTFGKGEVTRKFSDSLTMEQFFHAVDNGSKFDGCDIDDLNSTQHGSSRTSLSDLLVRHKDQASFDIAQGCNGVTPSHIYYLGSTFEYNDLDAIQTAAKTGKLLLASTNTGVVDTTVAPRRAPLSPFKTDGGEALHLAVLDNYMASKLRRDPKYQTIVINADVRGNNNRTISGIIGRLGNIVYIESPVFYGDTSGEGSFGIIDDTEIEFAGLRMYATDNTGAIYWEGQDKFEEIEDTIAGGNANNGEKIYSRGLLLGGGAINSGWGKQPDYTFENTRHDFSSESGVKYWHNQGKSRLTREIGSKYKGNVEDIDYSIITLDMLHD